MKYKVFLSDFDGTLVKADGTVSERNRRAIERYRAAGGIFAVCTGRMLTSILPRVRELGIKRGIVSSFQGAVIADIETGKLLKNDSFPVCDAVRVLRFLESLDCHIHADTAELFLANKRDELLEHYQRICKVTAEIPSEPLSAFTERERLKIVKILVMTTPDERLELQKKIERKLGKEFYVTCSSEYLVEILPLGQNKGTAVTFFAEHYGISTEEIAAIGDQQNDLPMLEIAGGKFTVENAVSALKKIARVMPSNEEDGVAVAIEKYVLGEKEE